VKQQRPLFVGLAVGSGSGKTTVARQIDDAMSADSVLVDMDAYYTDLGHLPLEERKRVNFDHPDAFDTDLFLAQLDQLGRWEPIAKPTYDYAAHTRASATVRVEPCEIILVEGILLFVDARIRQRLDVKIFVDVPDDIRFIRRLQRDVEERGRSLESVITQYLTTVRPMHLEFVEPSKRYADIILPVGGENRVGIEMIHARVEREADRRRGGR
jgi:uridine kinase